MKNIRTEIIKNYEKNMSIKDVPLILWGIIVFLLGFSVALSAYYFHISWLRYFSFGLFMFAESMLFFSMQKDIHNEIKSYWISLFIVILLFILYISLRTELPRFDFSVGDASDYYMAGVCSVTYNQDIGFFLPLTASVSAIGYTVFGIEYTPMINVLLYGISIPLSYFLFKRLGLDTLVSITMSIFLMFTPLSIWFSKTSFSDPIWQLMLLIFTILAIYITDKKKPDFKVFIALFLLLGLIPFLRGEAVLFYGLLLLAVLYHLWKFMRPLTALFIISSFTMLIIGTYLVLMVRSHYLLGWQFSRIIPHITAEQLMNILYVSYVIVIILIVLLSRVPKWFSRIKLPLILTVLAILFKIAIAYIYAHKKSGEFIDFFFMNEYSFILGNFGMVLSIFIVLGLLLVYYRAIKGDRLSLILVVMYTIFYIPFLMQNITFQDPHELFLYWNRYYFAILMMIHVFVLSLIVQMIYEQLKKIIGNKEMRWFIVTTLLLGVSLWSMNTKVQALTIQEAYLENSYKIFPWLVKRVGRKPIAVVYDNSVKYRRHNGMYDLKVFVARMFTVMKINAKSFQKNSAKELGHALEFSPTIGKNKYVLCLSSEKCHLENDTLFLVDSIILPISWREHYQAQPKIKKHVEGRIEHSLKNEVPLHVMLYKVR